MFKDLEKLKRNAARMSPKQLQILDWFDFKQFWSAASSNCTPDSVETGPGGSCIILTLLFLFVESCDAQSSWKKLSHNLFRSFWKTAWSNIFQKPPDQIIFSSHVCFYLHHIMVKLWLSEIILTKSLRYFVGELKGGSASCGCSEQIHFFKSYFLKPFKISHVFPLQCLKNDNFHDYMVIVMMMMMMVYIVWFLAVQNSSIGDLVTNSLTNSLTKSLTFTFDITEWS